MKTKSYPVRATEQTMEKFRRLAGGRGETQAEFLEHCLTLIEAIESLETTQKELVRNEAKIGGIPEGILWANLAISNLVEVWADWEVYGDSCMDPLREIKETASGVDRIVTGAELFWSITNEKRIKTEREIVDGLVIDRAKGKPLDENEIALVEKYYPSTKTKIANTQHQLEKLKSQLTVVKRHNDPEAIKRFEKRIASQEKRLEDLLSLTVNDDE